MEPGTYVEVSTKKGDVLKGLVMQSSDNKILSLKLDSGYNVGLNKKNIDKIKELKKAPEIRGKKGTTEVKFDGKLKTITILHTGGTVASRVSYATGAVSPSFDAEDIVGMFPELRNIANIKSKFVGNMFSEDMRFSHYNLIAKEIEKELKNGVDGIIVTHGTDTITFSACALAFALEGLNKPVILVGAQRSSDRPSSDAAMNLICAAQFITRSNFNEVGICMHGKSGDDFCYILPSCKTKKLHSSRRDAFKAVNSTPIAKINKDGKLDFFNEYKKTGHKDKLTLKLFNEKLKIGILYVHPNLFKEEVKMFSKFNGLIIEGTGMGHVSVNKIDNLTKENDLILKEIKRLAKKIPVVMTTQCIFGRVNMNVYDTGRKLQQAGVLGNLTDMTLEAAFIKLAWLLSNYKNKKLVKEMIDIDLRGEISKKINYEEEFI